MKLLLKNADGECVSVTVLETDAFSDLKARISEEENIDINVDDFTVEGKPIENSMSVVKYFQLDIESDKEEENISFLKTHTCRLCACSFQKNKLLDIFQMITKINACLPIKVDESDKLSKYVCVTCSKKLDEVKEFMDSCVAAERKQIRVAEERDETFQTNVSEDASQLKMPVLLNNIVDCKSVLGTDEATDELNEKHDGNEFLQVYCGVCQKTVKLTSLLKSKCHKSCEYQCFFCKSTTVSIDKLKEHLKSHSVEIVEVDENQINWKCTKCEILSNDWILFNKHFKSHELVPKESNDQECGSTQKQNYRCNMCSKSFRCKNRLEFHLKFHTDGAKAGQCTECRKEFASELCLYKHMLYNHLDRKLFTCEYCGRTFRNKSSLTYHFRSHNSLEAMKPFTCEICNKRFARRNILRDHMMNRHGSSVESQPRTCFQCPICNEVFPDTDSAISHTEIHHPEKVDEKVGYSFDMVTISKLFICEYCDKCFSLPVNLIKHRLLHGEIAKYQCKVCNEEFCSFVELKSHNESHLLDGIADYKVDFKVSMLFMCPYCEKCFKNYQAFNVHRKGHSGVSPYNCRFCSEVFSSYRDSTNHRLSSHNTEKSTVFNIDCLKPFECQYCNKAFTSGSALTKHIRIHTGEKPFSCRICKKSFAQSSGLYTHLKVHSNDRPYQCDLCNRSFKIIGDYKQHVRRHSGLRSYVCDVCKKSFITQRSFSQHKKIHMNVRPYSCDLCQQSFRRSHTLKIHKLKHARS